MSLTGGPNLYGWIGLIGFSILSLLNKSFWPIGIFLAVNGVVGLESHHRIWDAYNEFLLRLSEEARRLGYDDGSYRDLPITEYIYLVTRLSSPTKLQ